MGGAIKSNYVVFCFDWAVREEADPYRTPTHWRLSQISSAFCTTEISCTISWDTAHQSNTTPMPCAFPFWICAFVSKLQLGCRLIRNSKIRSWKSAAHPSRKPTQGIDRRRNRCKLLTQINVKLERLLNTHGVILEFRGTSWNDPAVSLGIAPIIWAIRRKSHIPAFVQPRAGSQKIIGV